jgi:hypothetical protein
MMQQRSACLFPSRILRRLNHIADSSAGSRFSVESSLTRAHIGRYCVDVSRSEDREAGQEVFLHLLDVYLQQGPIGEANSAQAMRLLNSHCATLDADKVLARVPLHWSIGVVDRFLRRSIRSTLHAQRTKRIEHGLARQENLQARAELVQLEARYVVVSDSRRCHGCHRCEPLPFAVCSFPSTL